MRYIQGLPHAFSFKIGEYRFNSGNSAFNAISIWKIDEHANEEIMIQEFFSPPTILYSPSYCPYCAPNVYHND